MYARVAIQLQPSKTKTRYSAKCTCAGSDLENKESSSSSARLSWLRIVSRESTHSSSSRARLGCFVEQKILREAPRHVSSRPDQSLNVGLDARAQGRAKSTRRGAGRSSSPRWLEFSESKNLTAESHEQKNE